MWEIIDKFGTLLGIGGAVIAAWEAYSLRLETKRRWQKDNELITVILRDKSTENEHKLAFKSKRSELTRAEILGLIGMIPVKNKELGSRFAPIKYTYTSQFMDKLNEIRESEQLHTCIVECETDEFAQFDYQTSTLSSQT